MFPHISSYPSMSPPSPCLHSFTQCHYGPTLTEAFIKCQLYTRDHTVEGEDTMIFDPKRSTCLWAFSSCWRTVCLLWDLSRPKTQLSNMLKKFAVWEILHYTNMKYYTQWTHADKNRNFITAKGAGFWSANILPKIIKIPASPFVHEHGNILITHLCSP